MYITDIVYLLDVLVVIVYMSYCNCWDYLLLQCSWGLKTQKKNWGGGEFFSILIFFFKNVPGVLKRMQKIIYFSGGDFGVRKTIHFFL